VSEDRRMENTMSSLVPYIYYYYYYYLFFIIYYAGERYFPLSKNVQTDSEAYHVTYSVGTRVSLQEQSGRSVKLTTYLRQLPSLRKRGAISPFLHMNSWRAQGQLYLAIH
jgi:hypothetical protein